jgi:hypothetical protein
LWSFRSSQIALLQNDVTKTVKLAFSRERKEAFYFIFNHNKETQHVRLREVHFNAESTRKKKFFFKKEKCRSFLVFLTIQPLHCQAA